MAKLYHKNPRQITEKQYSDLEMSLDKLGDLSGIVHDLNSDEIIGGNQRSRIFDINKCDIQIVKQFDEPDEQGTVAIGFVIWNGAMFAYRQVRWTEKQCEEANIRANKAGGTWDWDGLANGFEESDLIDWGFTDAELKGLDFGDAEPAEDPGAQVDRAEELREKWNVHSGDLWQLGSHRLVCGDCTDRAVVERVMGGEKAQLVYTDPPYGVDYDGGTKVREKLDGDTNTDLYMPACQMSADFSDEKAALFLWHAGVKGIAAAAAAAAAAAGYEIRCEIVWNKNLAQYGALSAQYKQKHEPLYYCYKHGHAPRWFGETNEITVWDCDRASVNEYHPTQKPVELAERAMNNHSEKGDIVADWFLGSGATLIACERLGRKCRAIEISPAYVAVALQRWSDMTGQTPTLYSEDSVNG